MQFKSLLATSILAIATVSAQTTPVATTGLLGDAAVISNNPVGPTYAAIFGNGTVTGKITFTANGNGTGVAVSVGLKGFKDVIGPFTYHIHDQPVPTNGNCNGTMAHLDPYQRGQVVACDAASPKTCEVGDLSGKHGAIPNANGVQLDYTTGYTDLYISTKDNIGAFIGNRSVVIHKAGGARLTCANITLVTNVPTSPNSPSTSSPAAHDSNSASSFGISSVLALGSLLAAAAFAL